jgi:hypothetical protein
MKGARGQRSWFLGAEVIRFSNVVSLERRRATFIESEREEI